MTEREAYIILNMLSGIGPMRLNALKDACGGSVTEIFERSPEQLSTIPGISTALAERISSWRNHADLESELELAGRAGVEILTQADEEYPELLREIHDAPICLYVRGKLPETLSFRSIAMVGTRNMSNYGAAMARHLAEAAGYAGWVVVSGLACGIDTVAHSAILETPEGETVAVLGGGLMRVHPQENLNLARRISERGAVISEFPMRFAPTRRSFPMRNRIISGLSLGTLVVEAGLNSGSLITASLALEQGRRVFAVPGQADRIQANGCNRLIRQGAVLVESFEHILEEFDFLPGFEQAAGIPSPEGASASSVPEQESLFPDDMLSSIDSAILDFLKKGEAAMEEIANAIPFPASEIMSALTALEILCRIRKNPDGRYRRLR